MIQELAYFSSSSSNPNRSDSTLNIPCRSSSAKLEKLESSLRLSSDSASSSDSSVPFAKTTFVQALGANSSLLEITYK
ncbi:Hypothetical predicted protein [Octopus vulgaris]|uniref:Uncharacterized protein n=1 Tax=Octopus vulgaris TaxID=6645 RepID=A0AA36FJG4_OCTVU|nr:Hypothetical predicted protein [Octopus vulgaris]